MKMKNLGSCKWFQLLLGFWFLEFIECSCEFPTDVIRNGRYVYLKKSDARKSKARELYILRFECDAGYERDGPSYIQCVDGEWTEETPFCESMECSKPPKIENGTFEIHYKESDKLVIGTRVSYSCKAGHQLEDQSASSLSCILSEEGNDTLWAGKIPVCQEIKPCLDPGVSKDGTRTGKCCMPGNIVQYSCNKGFEMVGKDEITCLRTTRWSSRRPLCKPLQDHCESPPAIPHGVVTGSRGDYFLPEDEARVLCEPGYKFEGTDEFTYCNESAQWEDVFGTCTKIFCEYPEPPENGTILELDSVDKNSSLPYNFEITYVCKDGYRLRGESWRICKTNGWTSEDPYCEEIECPDPGVPENGGREGSSFKVGEKVRFKCFAGYELLGSIERYCMPNGQWHGELARCDSPSNHCPNPGIPINGVKYGHNYDERDKVRFSCQPGYIHSGSEIRVCMKDGTWNGTETKCLGSFDYDNTQQVGAILKSKLEDKFDDDYGEWKRYRDAVLAGPDGRRLELDYHGRLILYFAFDVSGSVGLMNFGKSIDFAKAIVKKVGISESRSRAGALTFGSVATNIFLPMNLNNTEAVLNALDGIEYTGGGTSASSALHLVRDNVFLDEQHFEKKDKKTVLFLITDGKANMGGSPETDAETLKKMGVEIFCIGITGDVKADTLYKIASLSEYSNEMRPNVFILKNYQTLSWLVQDITNGTVDYSQCGLGMEKILNGEKGKILNGKKSVDPWPWMAALYFKDHKNKMAEPKLECGGSIISSNFILTAAHCFYQIDKETLDIRQRHKDEVIVKLGLTDIKNETLVQDFGVKKMYIHKRYVYGKNYDNDIVLLELDRPVRYSPYVRPVCLPPLDLPEESTFYKPQEYGWVTGWGHQGIVAPGEDVEYKLSKNLKQLRLPIQPDNRCTKSLKDKKYDEKLYTARMFCAGDGKTGNDTCQGDSGGPLMQPHMSKEGFLYWTQVGIVSWGYGCGTEGLYGYYTRVHSYLPWIYQIINMKPDPEDD